MVLFAGTVLVNGSLLISSNTHRKVDMTNFIVGVIFGIVLATVGATGIAKIVDRGVDHTKVIIQENVK